MADFLTLSPEVNSARMYAGGGPGSLSAAAAAWDELAAELWLAAASFESVCSGLADRWWQGPSSRMMAAQAARHTGWLAAAATQAEGAASQAQTMALAYEAAFAATVHPALVAANRALVAWLAGSNVFGQNTPAIAAAEAIYEQMWAQDVVAMLNYHAVASAVGARLRPWQQLLHELPRRLGGEHSDSTNTELANPSSTDDTHYRPRRISGACSDVTAVHRKATGGALCRAEHRDRHELVSGHHARSGELSGHHRGP